MRVESLGVGQRRNAALKNVVAVVRDKGPAAFRAEFAANTERCEAALTKRRAEWDDFDRQQPMRAEHRHALFLAHENDQASCRRRHNLFAQQGAATAFDQVEVRRYFVGAVHRDVDRLDLAERRERNAELSGKVRSRLRSGDAAHPQAGSHCPGESVNEPARRPPRAQADNIAVLDELKGTLGDHWRFCSLRAHRGFTMKTQRHA